jgi:predicted pyridoxine 5'-phosphate oxidase superfamily flavin-nucleotide-binding protein
MHEDLAAFLAGRDSAFIGTASLDAQPYIQHRGGPPGFLQRIGPDTIAFADYAGNRQYVTVGNLATNPRACMFLIDHATRQRIKLRGRARTSDDRELLARVMPTGYKARPERVIVFDIDDWEVNCPAHIPRQPR